MTARTLNEQISDVGGLISLLLVFVFAYFSALLPILEDLRRRPKPAARDDQEAHIRQLSSLRAIASVVFVIVVLVLGFLAPLSWRVLHARLFNPFETLRVGLLLIDLLLIATGAGVLLEIALMSKRKKELQ